VTSPKTHTEDLSKLLREGDADRLRRTLERLDEVQIAAQIDNLGAEQQDQLLQLVVHDRRPAVLDGMRYEQAAEVIRRQAPEEAAAILDELDSDDVVDILGRLDRDQIRQILTRFDAEDADEIEELLAYEPNSAGGIMSPAAIVVHDEITVAEALRCVREAEELPEQAFLVHVVDDGDRLVGVATLRDLVTNSPDAGVSHVMTEEVVSVKADLDQEDVADIASRYDMVEVPVVDDQHRLLGVVTIDDIVDVLREEATEDILKFAGAGEMLEDTRSFWSSFRARLPWLGAAALGGLLVAASLSGFEEALRTFPALALFMPVVAGMGGNVGTQSSTIVVRGLAVGYVERAKITRVVVRETALGACLGFIYGTLIAVLAPFVVSGGADPVALGLVITFGMMGSMIIAATVGTSMPLVLDSLNVDPAIATGPFVTTAVDILGLLFYFWLSTLLMGVTL
jgi:magnesium transporter